ncbi:FAD-dependent oxidoreductase [Sphingomonas sp. LHG3406-1]|uniref:FAD-dependent oxidoreductase n=1 Tax=Sphingomonas sp. LHG3406-1 TaxID=2804617 RepID=UPI0026068A2F|nr:FAD-dependent oxidoreductase [Sphingomonas sp. LHG3406-1]
MTSTDLLIIGGGPCGLMAGLLFARAGLRVRVVEKHSDFLHDFRGDTVHPSTMDVLGELGLRDALLDRPHQRLTRAELRIGGRELVVGDLSRVRSATPFVAMMPQWEFLDFLRSEAERYPGFRLALGVGAASLNYDQGRITGALLDNGEQVTSRLVIAADGRRSIVRRDRWLPLRSLNSSIDVLWFELPKRIREEGGLRIAVDGGRILVRVDRGSYWQCAFVVPKGRASKLLAQGIDAMTSAIEATEPRLGTLGGDLPDLDCFHLLDVTLDRLTRWHRPGLLAIGDAAHAMSPMGGIGINLAIQDAVAAANLIAPALLRGRECDAEAARVQRRRQGSTRLIQLVQKIAQDWVLAPVLGKPRTFDRPPWPLLLLERLPALRRLPGRAIALGIRSERVDPALAA